MCAYRPARDASVMQRRKRHINLRAHARAAVEGGCHPVNPHIPPFSSSKAAPQFVIPAFPAPVTHDSEGHKHGDLCSRASDHQSQYEEIYFSLFICNGYHLDSSVVFGDLLFPNEAPFQLNLRPGTDSLNGTFYDLLKPDRWTKARPTRSN